MLYHPYQRKDGGTSLPQETRDNLFQTALENVEYAMLLETEDKTLKYSWLFKTCTLSHFPSFLYCWLMSITDVQWHAIAFLLSELCVRTTGPEVERAWRAIDLMVTRKWDDGNANSKLKGHLWKPLRRLMAKAKAEREKALERETASTESTLSAEPSQPPVVPGGQENLMNLDFGVDRLYPTLSSASELKEGDPTVWQGPNVQNPPPILGQPMSMDITHPLVLTEPLQSPLPGFIGPEQFTTQPGFGDTWMTTNDMSNNGLFDEGLNWENWDDMVQEFGMQTESVSNGHSANTPSVFGSGANWY